MFKRHAERWWGQLNEKEKKFGKTLKSLVFAAKCLQSSQYSLLLVGSSKGND